jgi:hypothetical protein
LGGQRKSHGAQAGRVEEEEEQEEHQQQVKEQQGM